MLDGLKIFNDELMRQMALVNDLYSLQIGWFRPDGAIGLSVDLHGGDSFLIQTGVGAIIPCAILPMLLLPHSRNGFSIATTCK
jgi:hypothetical protein